MSKQETEARIALYVGGDLDEHERESVEERLAACPQARRCHDELQRSLESLRDGDDLVTEPPDEESVWPSLSARLRERLSGTRRMQRFNGWVPAATVACLLAGVLFLAAPEHDTRRPLEAPATDTRQRHSTSRERVLRALPAAAPAGPVLRRTSVDLRGQDVGPSPRERLDAFERGFLELTSPELRRRFGVSPLHDGRRAELFPDRTDPRTDRLSHEPGWPIEGRFEGR